MEWPSSPTEPFLTPEDIYYSVSLKRPRLKTPAKLQIKLPDSSYQVYYSTEIRPGQIQGTVPEKPHRTWNPSIKDITFMADKLFIQISNPLPVRDETKAQNRIRVRIQISDNQNRLLFDQRKDLSVIKTPINISLSLDWLERGKHTVIIEATDVDSGRSDIRLFRLN
jgi:hypothetical protein